MQLLLPQYGPVKTSIDPKFDYSCQLHSKSFQGLGNPDHIENSSYLRDKLAYGDYSCLNCEVFNMHSLLDRSVHCRYDYFGVEFLVAPSSDLKLVKYFIWYNFQACCIAGYRDNTPGSELSEHTSFVPTYVCKQ